MATCSSTSTISAIRKPTTSTAPREDSEATACPCHRRGECVHGKTSICARRKLIYSLFLSRVPLTSQGHEMTDDEDDSTDEPSNLLYDPFNLMPARENLQEFPGRVPTRKRKKEAENLQQDSDKPKVREILQLDLDTQRERNKNYNHPKSKWTSRQGKEKTFTFLTPSRTSHSLTLFIW